MLIDKVTSRGTPRRYLRAVFVLALTAATLLGVTTAASAHSELVTSSPNDGQVLRKAPDSVSLTFNEDVQQSGGAIVVTGPDNKRYDVASGFAVVGTTASVPLRTATVSGQYAVSYRIVSADGHVVEESYAYRVTLPGSSTTAEPLVTTAPLAADPVPASDDSGSVSTVWVLGLGAIGLVLIAAIVSVALRRRRD